MAIQRKWDILVLHNRHFDRGSNIDLQFLPAYAGEAFHYFHDVETPLPDAARYHAWDVIVLSGCALDLRFRASPFARFTKAFEFLAESAAVKIAFPERDHVAYRQIDSLLTRWQFDLVYTTLLDRQRAIYDSFRKAGSIRLRLPTYVDVKRDAEFGRLRLDFISRPLDLAGRQPVIDLNRERNRILKGDLVKRFATFSRAAKTASDFRDEERGEFTEDKWMGFLGSARYTSGETRRVAMAEPTTELVDRVRAYVRKNPTATIADIAAQVYADNTDVFEVNVADSSLALAAQMGTGIVAPAGSSLGVLTPHEDYLVLEDDLSNFGEIAAFMRDRSAGRMMAARAREKIMAAPAYSYAKFVEGLFEDIETVRQRKGAAGPAGNARSRAELARVLAASARENRSRVMTQKPYLAALTAKAIANLTPEDNNRAISTIIGGQKFGREQVLLNLKNRGFGVSAFTPAVAAIVQLYFMLRSDEDRAGLLKALYLRLQEAGPTRLFTAERYNQIVHRGEFNDLTFGETNFEIRLPAEEETAVPETPNTAPNRGLVGKQINIIDDFGRIDFVRAKHARKKNILCLINADRDGHTKYFADALENYGNNNYIIINPISERELSFIDFKDIDLVYINHSIILQKEFYISKALKRKLAAFRGPIIRALQDEYRWVSENIAEMKGIGTSALITSLKPENIRKVYGRDFLANVIAVQSPPGFLTTKILPRTIIPLAERKSLVSARNWDKSNYKPYYGKFMMKKGELTAALGEAAKAAGLPVNIGGTADRVYEDEWGELLMESRGHLALEGGSTMFDLESDFEAKHARFLAENPYAGYDEIYDNVFAPYENNVVHKVMTPRCIEAAAVGTVLIGMHGEYSGYLKPGRDYIVIADDGSNARDVLEQLTNIDHISQIAENARQAVGSNPIFTYEAQVRRLDGLVNSFFEDSVHAGETVDTVSAAEPARAETPATGKARARRRGGKAAMPAGLLAPASPAHRGYLHEAGATYDHAGAEKPAPGPKPRRSRKLAKAD